jgi:glycosyltransferase involved in cell wall biosynthesis
MQKGLQHVVNDTNYLRVLGQKIKHGQGFFLKIRPNVTFIPNCVDIKFFTPPVGQRKQNKILVSRNFRWDRGVDLAVQAFLLIKDKYPKFDLVLAGQTFPGPYLESIKKIIKKNKIHPRVVLFGHANRKELKRLYAASLISLVPTRDKEGTSLSALESMAMGTPCVSTRIGGLNDLPTIKCDVSSKDLSKAIIRTLKRHKNIGESQQRLVRQIFNLSNWRTAWVGVIRQKALSQTI